MSITVQKLSVCLSVCVSASQNGAATKRMGRNKLYTCAASWVLQPMDSCIVIS